MIRSKHSLAAAFRFAFQGIFHFFQYDRNGRIELGCGIITIGLAFWFQCSSPEWMSILLCIALVLSAEMLNSAIEKLADTVHPAYHENIKWVKDVAAGAVLDEIDL